jgi:hypothetical protein
MAVSVSPNSAASSGAVAVSARFNRSMMTALGTGQIGGQVGHEGHPTNIESRSLEIRHREFAR